MRRHVSYRRIFFICAAIVGLILVAVWKSIWSERSEELPHLASASEQLVIVAAVLSELNELSTATGVVEPNQVVLERNEAARPCKPRFEARDSSTLSDEWQELIASLEAQGVLAEPFFSVRRRDPRQRDSRPEFLSSFRVSRAVVSSDEDLAALYVFGQVMTHGGAIQQVHVIINTKFGWQDVRQTGTCWPNMP